jgi:hypothetical protein
MQLVYQDGGMRTQTSAEESEDSSCLSSSQAEKKK